MEWETPSKETYKLQNKDPRYKLKVEVHIDSGKLGAEFTVDKTIPDFNKGAEKIHLNWAHSFEEFDNVLKGQYLLIGVSSWTHMGPQLGEADSFCSC